LKKTLLTVSLTVISFFCQAQKIDSIYVNLYTDSLKKGTYNYINIDGLLSNGRYLPLDSSHLIFVATEGYFSGNSLWVEPNCKKEKITITATLRNNPAIFKSFDIYIKQKPDDEQLKTVDEILNRMKQKTKEQKKE
jgi:hypothetical protein